MLLGTFKNGLPSASFKEHVNFGIENWKFSAKQKLLILRIIKNDITLNLIIVKPPHGDEFTTKIQILGGNCCKVKIRISCKKK
jgi:hypothetical protein